MNLQQKIVEVRKVAEGFSKDKKGYDYTYVTGNQILAKIKDKMNELNLLLMPETKVGEWTTYDYKTASGKEKTDFIVSGEMSYTWIDGDNPEDRLTVSWAYYGQQDDISKAYGSALTYSERYFWLKALGLPTDEDDPDGRQRNGNGGQVGSKSQGNSKAPGGQPSSSQGPKDTKDTRAVSESQIKRMFGKAQGDADLVRKVCENHDYKDPADVKRFDYDKIVDEIEALAGKEQSPKMASEADINALVAMSKALKLSPQEMKELMKELYRAGSSKELTKEQAEDLLAYLEESELEAATA